MKRPSVRLVYPGYCLACKCSPQRRDPTGTPATGARVDKPMDQHYCADDLLANVGDREGVPVGDGVGEGEPLFEGVGVPVSDLVAVTVRESEGVPERVCVAVLDVVTVDVEESEAPGDGVCVVVRVAEHDGAASRKGEGQDSGQGHASGAPAPAGQ